MDFTGRRNDTILFLDSAKQRKFNLYFGHSLNDQISPKGGVEEIETTLSDSEIQKRISDWEDGGGLDLISE